MMTVSWDRGRAGHPVHVTVAHVGSVHVSGGWSCLPVKEEHTVLLGSSGDSVGQDDVVTKKILQL